MPAPPLLYRSFAPVDLDNDGRTVVGLAAPYGEIARADDGAGLYHETFDPGAFAGVVSRWPAQRCKVQLEHPERAGMGAWVGRGQEWHDGPEGLRVVLRLDDTEDGRAAAYKIRDGQTPAMSIAFLPGQSEQQWHEALAAQVMHRRSVRAISHVALVPAHHAIYSGARVEALRASLADLDVDRPPSTVDGLPVLVPTPRRDALDEWLATLRTDSPPTGLPPH
jgi:HK97 family phage prohead protease